MSKESDELVVRLRDMADRIGRHKYQIGDYWNAVEDAADVIDTLDGYQYGRKLSAIVAWLEKNQPDVFSRGLWDAIEGRVDNLPVPASAVVTEPPRCEECEWYVPMRFCRHAVTCSVAKVERGNVGGACGPEGRLWKARVG